MSVVELDRLDFALPDELEASEPPESCGTTASAPPPLGIGFALTARAGPVFTTPQIPTTSAASKKMLRSLRITFIPLSSNFVRTSLDPNN